MVLLDAAFHPPVEIGVVNIDIAELLHAAPGEDRPVWQGWYPVAPLDSLGLHVQRRPGTWSTARPPALVRGDNGETCELQMSVQASHPPPPPPPHPTLVTPLAGSRWVGRA